MKSKIMLLIFLLMTSAALAEEKKIYIGEVINPCGLPIKFTKQEVEIKAKMDATGVREELIFNGKTYPPGFFFYYSQSDGAREYEFWNDLKSIVKAMTDEEGISVEEKCKGKEGAVAK